ncbi:DUF881 domain-containing protein [Nocardioides sp. CN2-186]|uniref:DUF881 domain-containing protein n=1 Tax=Nocardioides tweenelious TaxID=3156607 RepID=UPI0032B5C1DE
MPDVNTPLLTRITQGSLDEDYEHVASRRAQETGDRSPRRPHWTAAIVVAAFGTLVAVAAVQNSQRSGVEDASRASLIESINDKRSDLAELQRKLVRLRELNVGLQDELDAVTTAAAAAESRNVRLAAQAGYGTVTGPGVRITVDDAPNGEAVRDEDLARLVNGLWRAGAEAISINGKRLTARSAIRNSGVAINVNGIPLSPPYVVTAIGNNKTLQADLLETTTGLEFQTGANALGFPVTMENVDQVTLPAARPQKPRFAETGTAEQNATQRPKETTQ